MYYQKKIPNLNIFPNPTSNNLTVSFDLDESSQTNLQVINTLGQIVSSSDFGQLSIGKQNLEVKIEDLTSGVYFIRISLEKGEETIRFIKE